MPSLRAELTLKLDASSLVEGFLTNVQGPASALQGITDPTPAGQLAAVNADLGNLDLGSLKTSVQVLAENALSIVGSLPIAGDVVKPVTDAIALLEALVANPEV